MPYKIQVRRMYQFENEFVEKDALQEKLQALLPAATLPAVRHFIESVSSVKVYFLVEGETPTRYSGEELGSKISSETGATEDEVKTLLYSLAPGDHDVAARSPVVFQVS